YAAPFLNERATNAADGMEKSYGEILKLLSLLEENAPVFRGSTSFLKDEQTPVVSPAALDLVERARQYSPEHPLYVVAIGAITNIASALLLDPGIAENIVVVWLGGHALHNPDTLEFNMRQDVAAARVVMGSEAPFVQLPCLGVVSSFRISGPELEFWLKGKNAISEYLAQNTITAAERYAAKMAWTRCLWDVTAVAWLMNDGDRFMSSRITPTHLPNYENQYEMQEDGLPMRYIYEIKRDALMTDLLYRLIG
ncbi:MAG: nucleoside hydrolase, partial [Clostridia bacterium]|nr:nucleoside hydrolase [Clostridia bacterium]